MVKAVWVKHKKNKNNGFLFLKNGQEFEIYTESYKVYEDWKDELRKICLVGDFHEEFNVTK